MHSEGCYSWLSTLSTSGIVCSVDKWEKKIVYKITKNEKKAIANWRGKRYDSGGVKIIIIYRKVKREGIFQNEKI